MAREGESMEWLTTLIDKTADSFGGLKFIVCYNIVTTIWVLLGIFAPWFPDHYPSNFYTMLVSWLAINMSSLLLYVGNRRLKKEREEEEFKLSTLATLLTLAEHQDSLRPLVKQIAQNQLVILDQMQTQEEDAHARR